MQTTDLEQIGPLPLPDPRAGRGVERNRATEPKAVKRESPPPEAAAEPADPKVDEAIRRLQHDAIDPNLRVGFFKIEGSANPVIRVYNRETGEIVRQIPEDDVLRIRERFAEMNGFLTDTRA